MSAKNESYITCSCGNPRTTQNKSKCACGLYFRKVVDCKICCITHKVRPESFCKALYNRTINDPKTKDRIVHDILSQGTIHITDIQLEEFHMTLKIQY